MARRGVRRIPLCARSCDRYAGATSRRDDFYRRDVLSSRARRRSCVQQRKVHVRLAQSLATELWAKGIHVAHVVIDGVIDTRRVRKTYKPSASDPMLQPEAIADAYWHLIQQDRSAWSLEIDLRPNKEAFFE